jgi:hypothetical protein
VEEGKWDKKRALGAVVGSTDCGVGMAPGGTVGGGSAHSRWRRASEHGRVAGRGRCGAAGLIGGVGRQQGTVVSSRVWEEDRKVRQFHNGSPMAGPGHTMPGRGLNSVLN